MEFGRRAILGLVAAFPFTTSSRAQVAPDEIGPLYSDSIIHDEPLPPHVSHCFNDGGLAAMLSDPETKVVVHHGARISFDGYQIISSHEETLPVYWNKNSGVSELDFRQVARILDGTVTNWTELGGNNVPVAVYAQGDALKGKALVKQFDAAGVAASDANWWRGNYDYLASSVATNDGAVAFGLRSAKAKALPGVNTQVIRKDDGTVGFKVPIHVYVKEGDPEAVDAAKRLLETTAQRAFEDGDLFPWDAFEKEPQ